MNERYQQIIKMYNEGYDYKAIASQLNYTEGGVRGRLTEFRQRGLIDINVPTPIKSSSTIDRLNALSLQPVTSIEIDQQKAIIDSANAKLSNTLQTHPTGSIVWLSDVHFPYHDPYALSIAYKIIADVQPTFVTTLNDLWDMQEYGRWDNIVTPSSRLWTSDINNPLRLANEHHSIIHEVAPHAVLLGVQGNHDRWVNRYLRARNDGFSEKNITWFMRELESQGVLQFTSSDSHENTITIGALKLVHGVSASVNDKGMATKTIEACRDGRMVYYTASGHVHRDFEVNYAGVTHYNFGCLCQLDVPYLKHRPLWHVGIGVIEYWQHTVQATRIRFTGEGRQMTARFAGHEYKID